MLCLPACQIACLLCQPACLPECLPTCQNACLPAKIPAWILSMTLMICVQDLAGKQLDKAFAEVQLYVTAKLQEAKQGGGWVMIATDGWKRRIAAGGAPLMNVMYLLSDGGSIFSDVIDVSGVTKDAKWVAQQHIDMAEKLSPGKLGKVRVFAEALVHLQHKSLCICSRFPCAHASFLSKKDLCFCMCFTTELTLHIRAQMLGFVMDNTKTNRAALKLLLKHCPQWICLGCTAHSIALIFKVVIFLSAKLPLNPFLYLWLYPGFKKPQLGLMSMFGGIYTYPHPCSCL